MNRRGRILPTSLLIAMMGPACAQEASDPRSALPTAVLSHLLEKYGDMLEPPDEPNEAFALDALVDLNADGTAELVVRGRGAMCGAANCPMWIFAGAEGTYHLLLAGLSAVKLTPQAHRTNTYLDVVAIVHGSASQNGRTTYQFDGTKYWPMECLIESYQARDGEGIAVPLKEPLIKRIPCRERAW